MATLTGKESALIDMLNNLIYLDFDAIEAYSAAIDRLDDITSKEQLRQFMGDHERHTQELNAIVRELGGSTSRESGCQVHSHQGKSCNQ